MSKTHHSPHQVPSLVSQMHAAFQQQQWDTCGKLCVQIESLDPNNPETANVRGIVALQVGDARSAEHYFVQAINRAPNRIDFQLNLGKLYLQENLPHDALPRFQTALQLQPHNLSATLGTAQCLIRLHQAQQANDLLTAAQEQHPNNHDIHMALFQAAYPLHQWDSAEKQLQLILSDLPEHADAHLGLADIAFQRGQFERAAQHAQRALTANPNLIPAFNLLTHVKTFSQHDQAVIDTFLTQLEQTHPDSLSHALLQFNLGKIAEDQGHHEKAFHHIQQGNTIRHTHNKYDADAELEHLQSIMDHYVAAHLQQTSQHNSNTPIFIVGMPRSGASLVEQILAAHPSVGSLGSCDLFESSLAQFNDPKSPLTLEKLLSLNMEQWHSMGDSYVALARQHCPNSQHTTDRTLTNIRFIGAIHKALPQAKIIHVRRNAMDTCWSIYKNNLMEPVFNYGFNLGELGYYYRTYERLMEHWRAILPSGVMYELDYEELVQHQEIETLKLLHACGLESDDRCFHFHQADDVTLAAHQAQVRQPIHPHNMEKWRHHEAALAPLLQILAR